MGPGTHRERVEYLGGRTTAAFADRMVSLQRGKSANSVQERAAYTPGGEGNMSTNGACKGMP